MIRFKNVHKAFGSKKVFQDLNLEIEEGKILFVLGKSGTGKSVLLKHVMGLLRPDRGEVWVEEHEVSRLTEPQLFGVRRWCGMVFQNPALLESFTVYENMALGIRSHRLASSASEEREKVLEKLEWMELDASLLEKYPPELPFGLQKRVSLARALAVEPRYLLFDEPTTAQDPLATQAINRVIKDLSVRLKVTCVVVSHDMESALAVAERIVVLEDGAIIDDGEPEALLKSTVPLTRAFLEEVRE